MGAELPEEEKKNIKVKRDIIRKLTIPIEQETENKSRTQISASKLDRHTPLSHAGDVLKLPDVASIGNRLSADFARSIARDELRRE
jgi:hypothetical protein